MFLLLALTWCWFHGLRWTPHECQFRTTLCSIEMLQISKGGRCSSWQVKAWLEDGKDVRLGDWKAADIEILNTFQLLTAKPVVYLVSFNSTDIGALAVRGHDDLLCFTIYEETTTRMAYSSFGGCFLHHCVGDVQSPHTVLQLNEIEVSSWGKSKVAGHVTVLGSETWIMLPYYSQNSYLDPETILN